MKGNRRRDTGPELRIRRVLHRRGLRYRVDHRVGSGVSRVRVDIAFTRRRLAVFVDGCFWHSCPAHGNLPRANSEYWSAKLARNRIRDERNEADLVAAGWTVVRVWEHQPAEEAARQIVDALNMFE